MSKSLPLKFLGVAIFAALNCCQYQLAAAQQPDDRSSAENAIRQAGKNYLAAIKKGNAKAIAALWTPDGTYTDEHGRTFKSRELIENSFSADGAANQTVRPPIQVTDVDIRFLTPDVAIQEGTCRITHGQGASLAGCFTAVWVRRDNQWKLATLKESRIDAAPPPAERLAVLEPFLGEWSGQTKQLSMHVSAKWNAGKTYLRRELVASAEGKEVFHGTQFIGWDPNLQEIRSWTFNEDGGYAEGLWSLEGNAWMVASTGVNPSGETASTTQIYKFPSKDKMLWTLKTATGEGMPRTEFQIELTRNQN